MTDIRHLTRREIDADRWDACVEGSGLGIAFGYSHYLDIMADDWDGLVVGDYEAVLPVPTRTKWGIRYAYPPRFMGPHPVYSDTGHKPPIAEFIRTVGGRFPFSDIQIAASSHETDLPHAVRRNLTQTHIRRNQSRLPGHLPKPFVGGFEGRHCRGERRRP
jgi:hypothetical protein